MGKTRRTRRFECLWSRNGLLRRKIEIEIEREREREREREKARNEKDAG